MVVLEAIHPGMSTISGVLHDHRRVVLVAIGQFASLSSPPSSKHQIAAKNQTTKQLVTPALKQQFFYVEHSSIEVAFELISGMIYHLPLFLGFTREDLGKHLKEFYVVYSRMKPLGIFQEQIELRTFPFSRKCQYYLFPLIVLIIKIIFLHLQC